MSYELQLLRAAADGVQPALLLKAPEKKAEYLFNVPDGFFRLALEQKLIPSARLSCVLLTSLLPASIGGFGGLFLRLKHDGHGQVQVIGPQGSYSIIHSLRHVCRWQHPKVFVSECGESHRPVPVFEDEYVAIIPLVADHRFTGCPWCHYTLSERLRANPAKTKDPVVTTFEHLSSNSSSSSDCSGSESDTSSNDTTCRKFVQSKFHTDGKLFDKSLSEFKVCTDVGTIGLCNGLTYGNATLDVSNGTPVDSTSQFCRSPDGREHVLPKERKRAADGSPLLDFDEETSGLLRDELAQMRKTQRLEDSVRSSEDVNCLVLDSTASFSLLHDEKERVELDKHPGPSEDGNLVRTAKGAEVVVVTEVLPANASGEELSKSSSAQSPNHYEWVISNIDRDNLPQLEDNSNPVYGLQASVLAQVSSSVEIENDSKVNEKNPAKVLGYVAYLKKLNTAILVVDCENNEDLEKLKRHPALSCIYSSGRKKEDVSRISSKLHTISSTVHLTRQNVVQSCDYKMWMASLKNPAHVVMNESFPEFGFNSSLDLLQRLNRVQPDIFPLPFEMVNPSTKTKQLKQEFTNSNVTIVDGGHSLCLSFCEEGTTWSSVSVDNTVQQRSLKKISSVAETSKQVQSEVSFSEADARLSRARTRSHVSLNVLAAMRLKKRLLQQKERILPSVRMGKLSSRESLSTDNTAASCSVIHSAKQDCLSRSIVLPLTTEGNQEGSLGLSHNQDDDTCANGEEVVIASREVTTSQLVLNDIEAITSLTKVARNCDPMLSQTRVLNSIQDCMRFQDPASEFQLVFLGTGCAEPSKKRGSSSILLQVRGAQGAMLLDAGEGAAGQLFRRFGEQGARTIISSLQCLWLSHKHGDHTLGVISILQTRSMQARPLVIIGPHKIGQWLAEVRDTCSARGSAVPQYTYIHCEELSKSEQNGQVCQQHRKQVLEVLDAMQFKSMLSVKVFHCHDAYGIILTGRHGWKLVYSGDTRPCKQLIEAGRGCTLLIHEATFEDVLLEQAKCKRHTTVSEAVKVGREMHAQHMILTHFSQRYPEMVVINGGSKENLSVAFDGMVVPSQLLNLLGTLLPHVKFACQKTVSIPPITDELGQRREFSSSPTPAIHRRSSSAAQQNHSRKPLGATHKRWLPDSDDEEKVHSADHRNPVSTLTWSSESDDDTELNESRSFFTGMLNYCPVQRTSLETLSEVDRPSSHSRETAGPFGGKHLRWIDSEDG